MNRTITSILTLAGSTQLTLGPGDGLSFIQTIFSFFLAQKHYVVTTLLNCLLEAVCLDEGVADPVAQPVRV